MKHILLNVILIIFFSPSFAQKPPLQLNSYKSWVEVRASEISGNGEFVFYTVFNQPIGKETLTLKSTKHNNKIEIIGLTNTVFSSADNFLLGKVDNDTLITIETKDFSVRKTPQIGRYTSFRHANSEWIVAQHTGKKPYISIGPVRNAKQIIVDSIDFYQISPDGNWCILKRSENLAGQPSETAWLLDLSSGKRICLLNGKKITDFIFDAESKQVAFFCQSTDGNQIWYYKYGSGKAELIIKKNDDINLRNFTITKGEWWKFSKDGKKIFFSLTEPVTTRDVKSLSIWNYQDIYLQSVYNNNTDRFQKRSKEVLAILDISSKSVKKILNENQEIVFGTFKYDTDTILVTQTPLSTKDGINKKFSYNIVSTKTGKIIPFKEKYGSLLQQINISPEGKYLVFYSPDSTNYYSYEFKTGNVSNLTRTFNKDLNNWLMINYPARNNYPVGIAGWSMNDNKLFIHTAHDFWMVDPVGRTSPVNLSKDFRGNRNMMFYIAYDKPGSMIVHKNRILLSVFDFDTKNYGFSELVLNGIPVMKTLSMGPIYSGDLKGLYTQPDIKKALKSDVFLFCYQKVNQPYNCFFTNDFKTFEQISEVHPQVNYNWMSSELHKYKDSAGHQLEGVLYKPENFDPNKKYPVIINYYTDKSNELNEFETPQLNGGDIALAQLVSNGYLVFKANIYAEIGKPGEGALQSIIAAADHLEKYQYVNSSKLAIAGHSCGGFSTNFIVTHTKRFAAAISAAGVSDLIWHFNSLWTSGEPESWYVINGPYKMGKSLSEDIQTYIENSPILYSNRVSTPLLLMHNSTDGSVPFEQSRSFFIQLRSLNKKVWLLSYKGEGHMIANDNNLIDYYTKINDFFGYYLKDEPMPTWMKDHI